MEIQKPARVQQLLDGWTCRSREKEILQILRQASREELNQVLQGVDSRQLVDDVDNHFLGPQNRTDLLELLSQQRVQDLDVESRARLIQGLQMGDTDRADEAAIRNLVLATPGAQLTRLKLRLDQTPDYHDLHQLMFHDVDGQQYRDQIFQHIAREATTVGDFKLLSDIDDTFYCNWKDERFPKGTVYPGVRQYYREMDAPAPSQPDDLTFVTARPDDRIGQVKNRTKQSLRAKGLRSMVVLAGSVPSLFSNELLATKKFQRMSELRQLYPEFDLVFTGDSGQGDALCGLKLHQANWSNYRATLIHDVVQSSPEVRQDFARQRVHFFDTYVGAALEAHSLGLLALEGARRVGQAAAQDFLQTAFISEDQRQARLKELQTDLDRLNTLLPPDQQVTVGRLRPLSELPLPLPPEQPPGG